ncbi:MAG: aldo/keto reductase [Cyanobacteria bacterium]|jgi:predicted aldo/keto reductase-like oxidoreductase|nr:aldo/keto reductase [Cyanobacteria bacterium GSL.Bin1]
MLYRRFGRTNLQMPVFSCGGMRYHYRSQNIPLSDIPQANQQNLEVTIEQAFAFGINHIETARGYGSSEMQLGQVLPKFDRKQLIIQTKIAPKDDPKEFRRQFHQSLQFLNLDYVDLLGIHGINTEELLEKTIRPGGCLEEVRKLQDQGKVRFVGFSTHGSTDFIIKVIKANQFDYVNLHWYYINPTNWQAIEVANRYDLGVFIISPSDKGGRLYQPPQKLVDLCHPLSPMVFNDLFCLSHSQVHTLSLGAAKPTDFKEHLKVLPLIEKADEILPPILDRLEKSAIAQLGEHWYKTWKIGLPRLEDTPNQINIPVILWLRNLALAYDLTDYAKMRYNLLGKAGHWFPGKKAENLERLDLKPCLKNSPHADKIPALLAEAHEWFNGETVTRLSQQ